MTQTTVRRGLLATLAVVLATAGGLLAPTAPAHAAPTWITGNSTAAGDQDAVAVAASRTGYVAIAWEDDRDDTPGDPAGSDVWVRLFRNGTAVFEKKVSTGGTAGTPWRHVQPDVGVDDQGRVVVAWSDDPDGNGYFNIPVRVFSATGTLLHSVRANADAAGNQTRPSVAVDPDASPTDNQVSYAVAWEDTLVGGRPRIALARFADATRRFEKIISPAAGSHRDPDLTVTAGAVSTVAWADDVDGDNAADIGLTRIDKAGAVVLPRTVINQLTAGSQDAPSIAGTVDGRVAVAWRSDQQIRWRGFGATAAPVTGDVVASAAQTATTAPSIGIDDQATVVVGWTTGGVDTWAHGFGPDGNDAGRLALQQLSRGTAGRQEGLVVAVTGFGEVSAAHTDDTDGNGFDQVVLGSGIATTTW